MGAYAVEYITASSRSQRGYYEISIQVSYRRTAEQIARRLSPYGRQKRPRLRGLGDAELVENIAGALHGLPVAGRSHDHCDFGLGFICHYHLLPSY